MPVLFAPDGGVNRQLKYLYTPDSAVNRKVKYLYAPDGGVNRKIYQSRFGTAQGSSKWIDSQNGWGSYIGKASADGRFQHSMGYDISENGGLLWYTVPAVKVVFDTPFALQAGDYLSIITKCTDNTNSFAASQAYYTLSYTGTVSMSTSLPQLSKTVGGLTTSTSTVSAAGTLSEFDLGMMLYTAIAAAQKSIGWTIEPNGIILNQSGNSIILNNFDVIADY